MILEVPVFDEELWDIPTQPLASPVVTGRPAF